ncbi:hypothetical protein BDZ91DRAFT_488396 [Kalaharituber pfeilii]|nr:hypothetical protein BDZ91DRAFT_488396 [Kalaharituber pfeilii]
MSQKSILRRVRPDVNDDLDEEEFSDNNRFSENNEESGSEIDENGDEEMRDCHDDEDQLITTARALLKEDDDDDDDDDDEQQTVLSTISFETLAKAQSSLLKRKKPHSSSPFSSTSTKADQLSSIKSQLQALRPTLGKPAPKSTKPTKLISSGSPPPKRPSKSAPAEMSSKRPVSRFREAIPVPTAGVRDPRFDPTSGPVNERQFTKNYAFLKEYREKEMEMLREQIKKTKGEEEKEKLVRALKSMESKKQAQEAKERAAALVAEHKKREKEKIKHGKTPYFLKRSEQKKMLLMDKYSKMGEKELERVIERKRKHKAAKERKNMPSVRRIQGE